MIDAEMMRADARKLSKLKGKHDKIYLNRAKEKRFEQQIIMEQARIKKDLT